jgi:tRNA (cmo5U34)-methyltransferase
MTQQVFDRTASTYDKDRARLIPGCDNFYRWAVDLIPRRAKRILELGAGSGILSALVRARFPQSELHLMDFSGPMLDLARERFAPASLVDAKLTFVEADYVVEPLPQENCAIVSSLSIHHIEDEDKRALVKKAYAALKPNGVFVNADQVAGPTSELELRYKALWLEQVRALGATEEQVGASLYRQREDRCASVETQLEWMRAAGFADADCWYKEGRLAVMAGTKRFE